MKNEGKIPTILGLAIITVSLVATVFLFKNIQGFLSRAAPDIIPSEIKITNLSPIGFTVSWITSSKTSGSVSYGEQKPENTAVDDRDQASSKTGEYTTHFVGVHYLKPETKYVFTIISGGKSFDNNGEVYTTKTLAQTQSPDSQAQPAYGSVLKNDGTTAVDAIVYLNLTSGFSYSSLVKTTGNWLITFSGGTPSGPDEKIDLLITDGSVTSSVTTTAGKLSPVPPITLGKNSDFRNTAPALNTGQQTSGFNAPAATQADPNLITPASGSAIPADRPVFSGTGVPGQTVTIEVHSATPVSGNATVDSFGNWSWTPPTGLSPGEHTVKIQTNDKNGKLLEFIKTFIVLASGSSVVEAATPSALTTPTPTPTPKPTLQPSPSATPATAPSSGNLTPTFFLLLLSITLIVLGTGKLIFPVDN